MKHLLNYKLYHRDAKTPIQEPVPPKHLEVAYSSLHDSTLAPGYRVYDAATVRDRQALIKWLVKNYHARVETMKRYPTYYYLLVCPPIVVHRCLRRNHDIELRPVCHAFYDKKLAAEVLVPLIIIMGMESEFRANKELMELRP